MTAAPAADATDRAALRLAAGGLLALAVAMGIGRFAFTPILPVMQGDFGLSVQAGGWLASANYAGYLIGALAATRLAVRSPPAILAGLLVIAVTTVAMGLTREFAAWMVWRTAAGVASALVLVHVSAWSLQQLANLGRPVLGGVVFAGVGTGIAGAGLVCLAAVALFATGSATLWLILGALSVLAMAGIVPALKLGGAATGGGAAAPVGNGARFSADEWRLVLCYGAFGFGYIIPATFLPVMARQQLPDPALFGWAWPVFGAAAAVSTLLAARAARTARLRTLWAVCHVVMAAGCATAALVASFAAVIVAALAVGGTFMVITMFGIQEARAVAGPRARPLIGAMTAAFALGQIIGPLLVRGAAGQESEFTRPLLFAALVLLASATALRRRPLPANGSAGAGT